MNNHFAELGDVWKHLPLAEILRINPPRHYWETHAGSASYALIESPSRLHGALRFLSSAPRDPDLCGCAYLQALQASPGVYPGSPSLALQALGQSATYLFCDVDRESAETLRVATASFDARVIEGDGVSAIYHEAQLARVEPGDALVHIDPFDPHERVMGQSLTPVELAAWLARAGYRLFYWYGYDSVEQRGWAYDEISRLAPGLNMWCGDVLMPACLVYPGRTGAWGCGVVLANMTSSEARACEQLGHALKRISETDVVASNDPSQLTFQVITMPESSIKIRSAGPGDVDAIVRIYVDSWNAGFGPRMPAIEADAARIGRWRKELAESSATRWWLAERGDVVVGFVGIGPSRDSIDPDLGELDTIAVDPVAWRTGVGKALMSVALEGLRSEGYHSAALWTLSDYSQAESFYLATGWRLNGATRRDGQEIRYDYEL
jgi:N-acetylglutamate synthase-like GNAT family acetyltransferase